MTAVHPTHVVVPGEGTAEVIALHRRPAPAALAAVLPAVELRWPARACCPHRTAAGPCVLPPHQAGTCLPDPARQANR